jgi:hypothetical protein
MHSPPRPKTDRRGLRTGLNFVLYARTEIGQDTAIELQRSFSQVLGYHGQAGASRPP